MDNFMFDAYIDEMGKIAAFNPMLAKRLISPSAVNTTTKWVEEVSKSGLQKATESAAGKAQQRLARKGLAGSIRAGAPPKTLNRLGITPRPNLLTPATAPSIGTIKTGGILDFIKRFGKKAPSLIEKAPGAIGKAPTTVERTKGAIIPGVSVESRLSPINLRAQFARPGGKKIVNREGKPFVSMPRGSRVTGPHFLPGINRKALGLV